MNRLYRYGALLLSATVLCSSLSACAPAKDDETTEPDTTTTQPEDTTTTDEPITFDLDAIDNYYQTIANMDGATVVATVDGVDITAGEYFYAAAYVCNQIAYTYGQYYGTPSIPWDEDYAEGQTWRDYIKENSLSTAALYALIPQKANELGLTVTQELTDEVLAEIAAAKEQVPEGATSDMLFWQLGTDEEVYTKIATDMYLYDSFMNYYIENGVDGYPTDDEVTTYADANCDYSAKHILLKTVDDSNAPLAEDEIAAQKAQAEDFLAQLNDVSGDEQQELFDSLMNEYSEDGRDPDTDELYSPDGYVAYAGQMVPEFESAARDLADYEISDIVESTFGYHIIMRLPMEEPIDYEGFRQQMIVNKVYEMQDGWMADSAPIATDDFDQVDVELFFENLSALNVQLGEAFAPAE